MTSNTERIKKDETEIFLTWSSEPTAPLIMLFGWAGCRDRYLAKYSQFYEEKKFSVLRFTVPITKVSGYSSYRRFAFQIYDKALNLSESEIKFPIFFHVFSMNGCSLFSSLWDLLDMTSNGEAIKKAVKGIIFDSCPANVMPWQGANAVSFASFPPAKYGSLPRTTYRYLLTGIFSIHRAIVWLRSNFEPNIYEQHFSYFHLIKRTDLPSNQLYLYSKSDTICSASSIDHFYTIQQQRFNEKILRKVWIDSLHVEHLRKYADEYTIECIKFVENSIANAKDT